MLNCELCESKEAMGEKDYVSEWGKHTATTLRMTKPWWNTGKVIVADSFFGSFRCAFALLTKGLYCVMNVKTNTAQFIKKEVLEKLKTRGDTYHAMVEVGHVNRPKKKVYASGHMDKQPMVLVHTCSTSGAGPQRKRRYAKYVGNRMDIRKWVLD